MGFSKDTYEKADREIKRRLDEALYQREKRHSEAVKKIPELLEIEDTMAQAGLATIKAVGIGNGGEDFIKKLAQIFGTLYKIDKFVLRYETTPIYIPLLLLLLSADTIKAGACM